MRGWISWVIVIAFGLLLYTLLMGLGLLIWDAVFSSPPPTNMTSLSYQGRGTG